MEPEMMMMMMLMIFVRVKGCEGADDAVDAAVDVKKEQRTHVCCEQIAHKHR